MKGPPSLQFALEQYDVDEKKSIVFSIKTNPVCSVAIRVVEITVNKMTI